LDAYILTITTYEGIVEFRRTAKEGASNTAADWNPEDTVEIDRKNLLTIAESICKNKECRYPLLALRLLIHVICGIDTEGRIPICARQLAKKLDVHYDTLCKSLKYLRKINVLHIER
jgi:hypothetical protein